MAPVKDYKALTINYWNRYLKSFYKFLSEHDLRLDFNQEVELIALEAAQHKTMEDAGKVIGRGFRSFLRKNGLRRVNGYWRARELGQGENWWAAVLTTGITPDGYDTKQAAVFQQRIYRKRRI